MSDSTHTSPVALITGGGRRIGASIVRHLHDADCHVLIHYHHSAKAAEQLCAELNRSKPNSADCIRADLLDTQQLPQLIDTAVSRWGRLNILVNNASSFYPTPINTINTEQWDDLIGSNLKAPLFLAQAAAAQLQQHSGCIINITDIHAERPMQNYPVYSIAKAGLAALTKSLAIELAPNVRVNAVAPGSILWPESATNSISQSEQQALLARTALARAGEPADIASAVRFLALDATYVTGQILSIDGGRSVFA